MDLQLRGRVALVMGASAGIGEAVALSLAREGTTLALAARRSDMLDGVAEQARRQGAPAAQGFIFDQADASAPEQLVARVQERFGRIDILIANGGGPQPGTFADTPIGAWDDGYASILRSMLQVVRAALPAMRAARWGRIIALTSMAVKEPLPGLVLSNAFRTALVAALKTLADEVASEGITVNCIATGKILTERLRSLYGYDDQALLDAAARTIPMRRPGTPGEFAPLVTFLASAVSSYITGQTLAIDGGLIKSLY